MNIGKRLKKERELIDQSLREVAKNINTTHGYLSKLERDMIEHPSIWTIYRLCKYYKISIDSLINENFSPIQTAPANRDK